MAGEKVTTKGSLAVEVESAKVPTFVLKADQPGQLRALMAAIPELPAAERPAAEAVLRDFELWESAHRGA